MKEETIIKILRITLSITLIMLVILAVLYSVFVGTELMKVRNNECLKKIAVDYCTKKGLIYSGVGVTNVFNNVCFFCVEDRKTWENEKFYFLDEELERCLR